MAWEKVVEDMLANLTSEERVGLDTVFQTCDYWEQVFMEIIGVTSAIYGLVFSLVVCVASVVIFTGHIGVAMIALVTILGEFVQDLLYPTTLLLYLPVITYGIKILVYEYEKY